MSEKPLAELDQRNRSVTLPTAGKDGIPERMTLKRWRARLKDADKFLHTIKAAQEVVS
jgi:hypothetical protein